MRLKRFAIVVVSAAILAACAAQPSPDHLGGPRARVDGQVVTADSRYGHGTVSGPARVGSHGRLEVRLPTGSWIECGKSCAESLRRQSVDFWENHGRDGQDGPGYFTWRR